MLNRNNQLLPNKKMLLIQDLLYYIKIEIKKISRGVDIGKYHAIVGVMAAVSMMISGFIVGQLGVKIIFYATSLIIFFSTLLLFYIKE